jgi:hypothetical protein
MISKRGKNPPPKVLKYKGVNFEIFLPCKKLGCLAGAFSEEQECSKCHSQTHLYV